MIGECVPLRGHDMPAASRRSQPFFIERSSMSEVAVPGICNVNPTRRICGNELNGDGLCLDIAFVPEDVYVVTTGIDKSHPRLCTHGACSRDRALHSPSPFRL